MVWPVLFCLVQGRGLCVCLLCCVQSGHVAVGTTAQPHEILADLPNDCVLILLFFKSFLRINNRFQLIKVFLYNIHGPLVELDLVLVLHDALEDLVKVLIINNGLFIDLSHLVVWYLLALKCQNSHFFDGLLQQYFVVHFLDSFDIVFLLIELLELNGAFAQEAVSESLELSQVLHNMNHCFKLALQNAYIDFVDVEVDLVNWLNLRAIFTLAVFLLARRFYDLTLVLSLPIVFRLMRLHVVIILLPLSELNDLLLA